MYPLVVMVITGPPTHSVRSQTSDALWRLSSSVTFHGGPVSFRPVRATPCYVAGNRTMKRKYANKGKLQKLEAMSAIFRLHFLVVISDDVVGVISLLSFFAVLVYYYPDAGGLMYC